MQAGKLRHRVDILAPVREENTLGEEELSYTVVATGEKAGIKLFSVGERVQNQQVQMVSTHLITMRFTPLLGGSDHVLRFGTRFFQIDGIENVEERNREFRITCRETTRAVNVVDALLTEDGEVLEID